MWGPWGGGWWGVGMGLLSLVFLGLIVAGIILVLQGPSEGPSRTGQGRRALDILDERFARGEIDPEEYQASKQVLTEGPR